MSWIYACLIAIGLFVALEIFATVTEGRARTSRLPMIQVVADERLVFRPVADDRHYAYDTPVTLNALGLRGKAPPAASRGLVIALGETQLYGLGVADDELATTIAERRLTAAGQKRPVLNAGVRAYSLAQQARLLDELTATLRPDHVVVFVYPFSIRNHPLERRPLPPASLEPYTFDLAGPAEGMRLLEWRLREALRHSAAIAWTWYRVKEFRRGRGEWGAILGGADQPAAARSYEMTAQAAGFIAALAAANGADLTFVAVPAPSQLLTDDAPAGFQAWVAETAAQTDAGYVDMTASLKALYRRTGKLPVAPYDDHYDAAAHALMADVIVEAVGD